MFDHASGVVVMSKGLRTRLVAFAASLGVGLMLSAAPAWAQIGSHRYAAIVLDHRTGNVLVAANADETRHPASLTKMMTLYMLFDAMREGRLRLDSPIVMSEEAASRPPSKLGIPAGQSITAEQAILALVTRSANDVAAAVGERLGGSEARFGQLMTMRARALGMTNTTFRNASGLPDPDQVTTARDMATLGRRLLNDYPQHYHYFGVTHAQFGGVRIRNHNRMLTEYEGVDGIKTGYIRDSGFNIVTSAERGGRRVVGAVFGGTSWVERDAHMASLLDQSFEQIGVASRRDLNARPVLVREATAGALPRATATAQAGRAQPRVAVTPRPAAAATRQVAPRPAATARSTPTPVRTAPPPPAQRTTRPAATPPRPAPARPAATPSNLASPTRGQLTLPPPRPPATLRTAELR
jgi:D-alanyl-D-alanine carboxypeptidase